jgi:hypothetical protein
MDRFNVDDKGVRPIVVAYYEAGNYVEVCRRCAELDPVSEYHGINNPRQDTTRDS